MIAPLPDYVSKADPSSRPHANLVCSAVCFLCFRQTKGARQPIAMLLHVDDAIFDIGCREKRRWVGGMGVVE